MAKTTVTKTTHYLGVISLALITVAAMFSLSGLTENAVFGFSSIFFYVVAGVLFFIPAALCAAFLATRYPTGGINVWVREAFGERTGLLAIWLQWVQSLALYMTILSFAAATLAFVFNPALADNNIYILAVILVVFWGVTAVNFGGMKLSTKVSTWGVMLGTLLPGAFLILLSLIWLFQGNPIEIPIGIDYIIPTFEGFNTLVLAIGGILLYAGIEMSAAHITRLKDPSSQYPKAIFLAAGVSLVAFILGSLAIAMVVPEAKISLVAGIMESFTILLNHYAIGGLLPFIAVLIVAGTIAGINTWIAGPSRGLLKVAREGALPPIFQKVNSKDVPTNILLIQAVIVTILGAVFMLMPDVSDSFWILTAMTAQIYLTMYILMFAATIYHAHTKHSVPKKGLFNMPGGKWGVLIIGGIGLLTSVGAILIGFLPPAQEAAVSFELYAGLLLFGLVVLIALPLLMFHFKKKSWRVTPPRDKEY